MADIYIDKIVIENLYFGGVNDFYPSSEEENPDNNTEEDETTFEGSAGISVNTDFMANAISKVEDIDLETVKKVLEGAGLFLKSYAKIKNEK